MKKKKSAFSLAEVLIVISIVSVIATMGFSITKKNIDRAYDLYVYTGYKGISDAISEALYKDFKIDKNQIGACQFTTYIYDLLRGNNQVSTPTSISFDTPNGVSYSINHWGTFEETDDTGAIINTKEYYYIIMQIPTRVKTVDGSGKDTICLAYMPDDDYGVLIPYDNDATSCTPTIANLIERSDLLPFYIDNGFTGRVVNNIYTPKAYRSLKNALCRVYGGTISAYKNNAESNNAESVDLVTCNAAAAEQGIVKLENPRKAW